MSILRPHASWIGDIAKFRFEPWGPLTGRPTQASFGCGWLQTIKACAVSLIVSALIWSASPLSARAGYVPSSGFVPDAATAVAIARAVLIPIYGAKVIQEEEPLTAQRNGDIWVVKGTLLCPKGATCPGGAAELKLSAKDGRILRVIHYK